MSSGELLSVGDDPDFTIDGSGKSLAGVITEIMDGRWDLWGADVREPVSIARLPDPQIANSSSREIEPTILVLLHEPQHRGEQPRASITISGELDNQPLTCVLRVQPENPIQISPVVKGNEERVGLDLVRQVLVRLQDSGEGKSVQGNGNLNTHQRERIAKKSLVRKMANQVRKLAGISSNH